GGWRLFVPVANGGEPSRPLPPAINRGDGVSIAVSGDGFTVSQPGEALENGAVGAWIRVRLAKRGSGLLGDEMRARVVRPGLVSIPMP
ncbi:MAG: flagella basal body P-ring formation protein FlgA, partial [Novosphingobium sp.]|nr:flagella basal body P-ring formation protein FlgA [Novosphingobium sp.]